MTRTRRVALACVWIGLLGVLGWLVQRELVLSTDLRLFLPAPTTEQQRLLLDEIGEGPASRALVVALSGADAEVLADTSRALVAALNEDPLFRLVTNGDVTLDAVPDPLLAYRYLLTPTLDTANLDAAYLREQLQARERDLASPAGTLLEPWLARDPTLELLKLVDAWQPMQEPNRLFDVWFDRAGQRALIVAETRAPAFDPGPQRTAIQRIESAFAALEGSASLQLTVSGAGRFSMLMEERTRTEAQWLGTVATSGMLVLLLIAYRNVASVALSALPLATAGLAGLAAVSLLFGAVHGITLAFGFTLIGVAQDYPLHLLSHRRRGHEPLAIVRELWPTLATGVASTCIAYLTFLFSGVIGLAQLACFTIAGLAAASLSTRYLLPRLMGTGATDHGESRHLDRLWDAVTQLPRPWWIAPLLLAASVAAVLLAPQPLWENDLSKLTPVPQALLVQDQQLRSELGSADLRYMLVASAPDEQRTLERLEALDGSLQHLVSEQVIDSFDHAARYLPSARQQRARQQRLPAGPALQEALSQASHDTAFRAGAFEAFLADVAAARTLPPLTLATAQSTPLGASVEMLLQARGSAFIGLITLTGVRDPVALQAFAAQADVLLLDMKEASETLVSEQRTRLLWTLLIAAALLVAVVAIALRSRTRVVRVLAPMALTTGIVVGVLQASGISLTLFHLIALMLAAGLGLDYALFFEHAADDRAEQRRTLHAVIVCSLSTLMVFALLASSTLPVLRAIGLTVSLGVVSNFALALLLARGGVQAPRVDTEAEPRTATHAIEALVPHKGTMCLLQRIVEWNDASVTCSTNTHQALDNPLRSNGRLRAVHLCEYGAQAMAVHGALQAQAAGQGGAAPGMLVSLRSVTFGRDRIDDLQSELTVHAQCLLASASNLQYAFRITHDGEVLCEGRAAVVLQASES